MTVPEPETQARRGPLVLVTNDDGVGARGLRAAVHAVLAAGGRPLVVAPADDMSCTGMALGRFADSWFRARPVDWSCHGLPGVEVYEIATYPAVIVTLAAMGAFGARPDAVVAGVNHGANTGVGVVHSATVGAALTGGLAGLPAAAVSVADGPEPVDWDGCARAVGAVLGVLLTGSTDSSWVPAGALNVNVPRRPPRDPAHVDWCDLAGVGTTEGLLERRTGPGGALDVRLAFRPTPFLPPGSTDSGALLRRRVTLSWLALPHGPRPDAPWRARLLGRLRALWPGEDDAVPPTRGYPLLAADTD